MKATKFTRFLSLFLALLMCVSMLEAPLADAAGWRTRGSKGQKSQETVAEEVKEETEEANEENPESPVSFLAVDGEIDGSLENEGEEKMDEGEDETEKLTTASIGTFYQRAVTVLNKTVYYVDGKAIYQAVVAVVGTNDYYYSTDADASGSSLTIVNSLTKNTNSNCLIANGTYYVYTRTSEGSLLNKNYYSHPVTNAAGQRLTFTVEDAPLPEVAFTWKEDPTVELTYDDNGKVITDGLNKQVWDAVVAQADVAFEDVTMSYKAETGKQKVTIKYVGSGTYKNVSFETNVTFVDTRTELVLNVENDGAEIKMPYKEDGTSDYGKLADVIWETVVAEGTTAQRGMMEFTYKYTTGEFIPLEGKTVLLVSLPAIDKEGFVSNKKAERTIKISFPGNAEYKPVEATVTINLAPDLRVTPVLSVNGPVTVEKTYTDNGVDYDALRQAIVSAVTSDIEGLELTTANCELTYQNGILYFPLEGQKVIGAEVIPAVDEVKTSPVTVRVSFGGNDEYKPAKIDVQVVLTEPQREESALVLNQDGPAVAIPYAENGVDAAALKAALWNALYVSSNPEMTCDDVEMTFHTAVGNQYVKLDAVTGLAIETYDGVKFTFAGNSDFLGCEATAPVSFVKSSVEYVEGQSITYHWDVKVMEAELMKIVAETSVLPEGTLSFEYKIGLDALNNLGIDTSKIPGLDGVGFWAPVGGGEVQGVGLIPRMGAGTHQVRVRTSGMVGSLLSKDQGVAVVVNKAACKVSVKSASTYADLADSLNMVTVSPAEETDLPVITVYAGATSDIAIATYIDLSMNSKLYNSLKDLLGDKLQDGITPQELVNTLNKYVDPDKALEVLKVFGVDTTILQKLVDVIQGLPTLGGRNRIAFGTPNRAGLYNVTAIAGSMNYNYSVGTGTLLLRARTQGVKLSWNQSVPKTVALADLGSYDFGASVLFNGVKVEKNANVVIRFTGLTKSFKLYSSHNAPKEPGSYVVTASTIGGNYLTTPITRTLKIK